MVPRELERCDGEPHVVVHPHAPVVYLVGPEPAALAEVPAQLGVRVGLAVVGRAVGRGVGAARAADRGVASPVRRRWTAGGSRP